MNDTAYADEIRPRHRWTVADYHKLGETGLLPEAARVELLDGEIIEMAPIGSEHAGKVRQLEHVLASILGDRAIVSAQNPIVLGNESAPQPDIAVLRWRDDFYVSAHPGPKDILLLIEVADTSVRYDREVKIPLYARHGIPETWLLDLRERRLEVYRNPREGEYTQINYYRQGLASPELLTEAAVDLADLFPKS